MPRTILYPVNELKIGGAEQQLLELVRRLDKERFRPIVAPLYPGGALDQEFRQIPGGEVIDLGRRGKRDPSPLWRIARLLRQRQVDIIQPFLSPATFFGVLPALVMRTPVKIITERCGVRNDRGIGYKTYRTLEDWLSRFADGIVPNSFAGERMVLDRGLPAAKIRVIYNGINLDRLKTEPPAIRDQRDQLGANDDGFVVGILASLTRPKGHDVFLRAIASLQERLPGLRVAIIGDGPERSALEALSRSLNIDAQVSFCGYQRNVANYLAACDLLVSASRDNEGCSNSILEAMALHVPVIATDIGGNRELVRDGDTGFLVPVDNVEALAQAICRVAEQRDAAQALAARAFEMVNTTFSLERMVCAYEELYDQLLTMRRVGVVDRERTPRSERLARPTRTHRSG